MFEDSLCCLIDEGNKVNPIGWRTWLCWGMAIVVVLWAIWRTLGLESGYPFVQVMAYTPQFLLLSGIVLLAILGLRQWLPAAVTFVAVAALGFAVLPRAFGGPDERPEGGQTIRLLSVNTLRGNVDVTRLLEIIESRHINVLSLQELPVNGVKRLKRRGLQDILPYRVLGIEDKGGGGVYSRFPAGGMAPTRTKLRQPRAMIKPRASVPFEVMSVHPRAPQGRRDTDLWEKEMGKLPVADEPGPPRVLAGDFNATLDHARLRDLLDTGYRDAGSTTGAGLYSTWPSFKEWPPPVTIDHALVEDPIAILDYKVLQVNNTDHKAVYTELVVPDA